MKTETNDEKRLGRRIDILEIALVLAGAVVVAGLLTEDGPAIWQAIITKRRPAQGVVGGLLVTVGVLLEVVIAFLIARAAKQIDTIADAKVAEALERAAKAEQAAAEANLARAKIEQRMRARSISSPAYEEIKSLLADFGGEKRVDIVAFDHHVPETKHFVHQLIALFVGNGWKCDQWESRAATYRIPGPSTLVAIADGHVKGFLQLANALAGALNGIDIESGVSPGSFSCKGLFTPGDFELMFQNPLVVFGRSNLAPFRVQVGAKQLAAVHPPKAVIVSRKGP